MKEHIFINGIEHKKCSTCKELKLLENYSNNKKSIDGLKPYCKKCASEKGKIYRMKYHEEDLQRKREWYKNTKNKAEERTSKEMEKSFKKCSRCGEEKSIKEFRQRANGGFYSLCRECENGYNLKYRKLNPDVYKANHAISEQRRRKQAKLVKHEFNNKEWIQCKQYFNNKCAYCGEVNKHLDQDHFVALSEGGNYTKDNIIPSCRSCNSSKGKKNFEVWYENYKYYSKERESKIKAYLNTFL